MRVFPVWFRLTGGFPCQWEQYGAVLCVVYYAITGMGLSVMTMFEMSTHVMTRVIPAMAVGGVLVGMIWWIGRAVSKATILEWETLHCVACAYELPADEQKGRCPECGRQFVRASACAIWEARYPGHIRFAPRDVESEGGSL